MREIAIDMNAGLQTTTGYFTCLADRSKQEAMPLVYTGWSSGTGELGADTAGGQAWMEKGISIFDAVAAASSSFRALPCRWA